MKIDWHIPLPVEFIVKWKHSLKLLAGLEPVYIMRNYLHGYQFTQSSKVELHGFCDASQKAAAAVVYLRAVLTDRILCSLVAAKTKVAPIEKKTLTIPKLELMSCLLLSRLLKSVIASLRDVYKISQVLCWSDANDCVHWINNAEKVRKKFIQGKVEEIRKNVSGIK